MRASLRNSRRVTFVEVTLATAVLAIIAAIILPFLNRANQKGHMARWKSFRSEVLLDRSLVTYYDFNDGKGEVLTNSVAAEKEDYDPIDFNGRIMPGTEWEQNRWKMKWALKFNGESSHIFADVVLPKNSNTIIIWFKTKQQDSALFSAAPSRDLNVKSFRSIFINKGILVSSAVTGSMTDSVKSLKKCADDKWHMVAISMGAKNKHSLYVDGEKISSSDQYKTDFIDQKYILLGYSNNTPYFKGLMDEFLLYDRELTEEEILKVFKAGSP